MPVSFPHKVDSSITIITPTSGRSTLNFPEIWRYRELLLILVWRNTIVRYKQSLVGIAWALIKPITSMIVFSIIFGHVAKLPSDGIPYPLFTYVAILPWTYFSGCLVQTSGSLVGGSNLLKKVYFPRLILPMSHVFTGLVDFCISFTVLIGMMVWYREYVDFSWRLISIPGFLFLAMISSFAFGLWLCSLMVKYRDIAHLLPFITQIWQYVTPVAYAASLVPDRWRLLYTLNPITGVVDGFRWAILGSTEPHWHAILLSSLLVIVLLVTGLYFFRKTERTLVDIV